MDIPRRSLLLFVVMLTCTMSPLAAQSLATVYLSSGFGIVRQDPQVDLLRNQADLPEFSDSFVTFGGGIRIGGPNLRVGWHVDYLLITDTDQPAASGAPEGRLAATRGILDVNLGLLTHRGRRVFVAAPTLGVGYEQTRLSLRTKDDILFDDLLQTPNRGVELHRFNILLDAALQFDLALKHEPEFDEAGRILTLRLGYTIAPFGFAWRETTGDLDNRKVEDGPDFSLTGPYVRIGFGF